MPRSPWSHMPIAMPGGSMMPHLSARMRTEMVDMLFVGSGGFERALAWINKDDDNYGEFFKIYAKGAIRASSLELTTDDSVEAALAKLDAGEHAKVINGSDE